MAFDYKTAGIKDWVYVCWKRAELQVTLFRFFFKIIENKIQLYLKIYKV